MHQVDPQTVMTACEADPRFQSAKWTESLLSIADTLNTLAYQTEIERLDGPGGSRRLETIVAAIFAVRVGQRGNKNHGNRRQRARP